MDKSLELSELVINFLKKYNIKSGNFNEIKKNIQKQLMEVEEYFQQHIGHLKQLSIEIKESKLSLLIVSEKTKISRSSIYNSTDVLKDYIEKRIEEIEREDLLGLKKVISQKNEMAELKSYLENVQINLIENEILENKIGELEKELKNVNEINQSLLQKINELTKENQQLKIKTEHKKTIDNKVLNFKKSNEI